MTPRLAVALFLWVTSAVLAQAQSGVHREHSDVVVALDVSRSLSPAQLEQAATRLSEILDGLAPQVRVGIVTFSDEVRWLRTVDAAARDHRAALTALEPEGNFTVLYDALFQAARSTEQASRDLPEPGGVVLLASDGRDENSAVLLDDVLRRFEAASVRVVAAGTGRSIDDRGLRRLALLTGGAYLGRLADLDPADVAAYLVKATRRPAPKIVESPAPVASADALARQQALLEALVARINTLEQNESDMRAKLEQAQASLDTEPATDAAPLPIESSGDLTAPPPRRPKAATDVELAREVEHLGNLLDDAVRKGDFDRAIEIPGTDISLRIGGRLKLDVDYGRVDGEDSATDLRATASRFSLFAQKPTRFGRAGGFLEADFAGNRARIRHAYAQLGPLLAGQTWSNFAHLQALPSTVAVDPVGAIARRVSQLRWTWAGENREFALALEESEPTLALDRFDRELRRAPDLTAHLRFKRPTSDIQVAGVLRRLEFDGDSSGATTGWGLSASASVLVGETDRAVFGALYGEGVGSYVIGFSGGLADASALDGGSLRAIEVKGGYVGYEHRWGEKWRSTAMASYTERGGLLDSIRIAASATFNVIWNPIPGFGVGAELLRGTQEEADGTERDEDRIFLAIQFGF